MEIIFINTGNSKTNGTHKCVLNLSQRLDLSGSNKRVALQNVSVFYTWKNIRKHYKYHILKIIAPTWNYEFEFPDGSFYVSDIQDHLKTFDSEFSYIGVWFTD